MKKRSLQFFVVITVVLCLLTVPFNPIVSSVLAQEQQDQQDECQVDKETAKKAAESAEKAANGSFWGGLAASVLAAIVAAPAPALAAALVALEAGLMGLDRATQELIEKLKKKAEDPPYTEVFEIRPRTLDPWLPDPTTSLDFAAINFINDALRAIEATEALAVSLEREMNAYSADDLEYIRLQANAVLGYTTMLIDDLTHLASSSAEFYEEWVKYTDETGITLTPEDVESYQQRIATEGFSDEELQAYKEGLLATDEDIEWIKNEILSADPVAEWEDIEGAFPQLDDVLLSTLPAFTDLANEVERILSECFSPQNKPCCPTIEIGEQNPDGTYPATIVDAIFDSGSGVKKVVAMVDGVVQFEADDIGLPQYEFSFVVNLYPGTYTLIIDAWDYVDHDLHKERLLIVEDPLPSPPPKPPGVPGMTGWGIIASVVAVAGLMLVVVRRRGREMRE